MKLLLTVHTKRFPKTDGKNRLRPVKKTRIDMKAVVVQGVCQKMKTTCTRGKLSPTHKWWSSI